MERKEERALIGSIQKFSVEDGPGIRTTIFIKGCTLDCEWCHNPELISKDQELILILNNCIECGHCIKNCSEDAITINSYGEINIDRNKCNLCLKCAEECFAQALRPVAKQMSVTEVMEIAEQDKGFYDNTGGGITISGGEILMFPNYVLELIEEAEKRDINVCLDTSGYGDSKKLMEMALTENVTNILYDIKVMDEKTHIKYTGVSNKTIIDNLKMLLENEELLKKIIIRMPLVKNVNDNDDNIKAAGKFYKKLGIREVHLLPYHSLGLGKKKKLGGTQKEFEKPSDEKIEEIKKYFESKKIKVKVFDSV